MNRKQQVAVAVMAIYFIVMIQSNISDLWLTEEEIIFRFLDDERISVDPGLEDLEYEHLRIISNQLAAYIRGKTVISLVNSVLLVYLFASYLDMYRETRATFTLGLVFLSGALLSYSLFTNPVLLNVTGGTEGVKIIRYFNVVPDLFTTVASTILIYLSRQ
ncbi:MAG: hypothetical protein NWE89_05430 [Candidatus Bathyarchaeota archaeon]|nr:hypothetical protein [Candidatus Bathyarchaeota archaeon]